MADSWYTISKDDIKELLPNRTYNSCAKQVKYLKDRGWRFKKLSL